MTICKTLTVAVVDASTRTIILTQSVRPEVGARVGLIGQRIATLKFDLTIPVPENIWTTCVPIDVRLRADIVQVAVTLSVSETLAVRLRETCC
jgi:hypothetical protein